MVGGWGLQRQLVAFPPGGGKVGRQTGPGYPGLSYLYEGSGCSCARQASAGSVWGWVHGAVLGTTGNQRVLHLPCTGKSVLKLRVGFVQVGWRLRIQKPLRTPGGVETEEETWRLGWPGSASHGTVAPYEETAESLDLPGDSPFADKSSWPQPAEEWQ